MRCKACNKQLRGIRSKKPDGTDEDMCSTCRTPSQYLFTEDKDYEHSGVTLPHHLKKGG